jgi:SNF2-related domain/SNF2 Helicase protein/Helicase conserved C-terminal domain
MLAIHGIWAHGVLSLWAEDSEQPAPAPPPQRVVSHVSRPHPFAASAGLVADVLAEVGEPASDLVRKAVDGELALWLPAAAGRPVSSPDLLVGPNSTDVATPVLPPAAAAANRHPQPHVDAVAAATRPAAREPASASRIRLAPWQVPVLSFDPAAALALLRVLASPDAGPERGIVSGSVQFLAALAALAADLVARGRVLPAATTVDADETGGQPVYVARWRPVLAGADALRARELTAAMPPLCRATSAIGESSAAIVAEVLDLLTDAAVRSRLSATPGFRLLQTGPSAPLTDRWAAALTTPDGEFGVAADETAKAAQLAFVLWTWHDAAQEPPGPVRTCFRLVEPPEQDLTAELPNARAAAGESASAEPVWQIQFALQSTDDPSLLLPASDIWAGGPADGWATAGLSYPEDDLLAGLGRASRLFPELDAALQTAAPSSVALDTRGALHFLTETGPLLAGAGFGVQLPDWVRRSRLGLKLTTRTRSASATASATAPTFSLADLVDFRYELAIGDQALDPAELAELARLKVPLVRLRGQWVELDERHLKAALAVLARGGSGVMTAADALAAGVSDSAGGLPLVEVDADGWLGDLLSGQADRRIEPMGTPASFRGELRPYQQRGLAWLSFLGSLGLGAVLADDMGLGKSPQTLALLQAERDGGPVAAPTLLICPMSLVGNWQHEAAKFTPGLAVHVHHGSERLAGPELAAAVAAADLVITTYGVATRDRDALAQVPWARVVCDEAQNIKNAGTRQAQAVRAIPAASRVALTGTPVENRLTELWSIMEFTSPGLLGSAESFRRRYVIPIERNADPTATDQLKRVTAPFILRRLKTDKAVIADLPDKLEMKVWCNLTTEQASLYQATVDDMMDRIEAAAPGIERRGLVLATMAKLKQVCNHPAHLLGDGSRLDGRSGKLARLEEICDEIIDAGDKALCFTQYAEFGRMLQPYLAARLGCSVHFLHGGTTKKRRDEMVAEFQAATEPALFLLSLKAGGTGLNLTAASHVIHIDRWWNPAVEDQATDRAFRIGQRRDVQVRKFVCVGTVEERIDQMIEEKKALAETIIGTGEAWLTELSIADLRQVIELSPEAVSQ